RYRDVHGAAGLDRCSGGRRRHRDAGRVETRVVTAAAAATTGSEQCRADDQQGCLENPCHFHKTSPRSRRAGRRRLRNKGYWERIHQRPGLLTARTRGVTKISSSAFSVLRPLRLKRLPRTGTSPRKGTLLRSSREEIS